MLQELMNRGNRFAREATAMMPTRRVPIAASAISSSILERGRELAARIAPTAARGFGAPSRRTNDVVPFVAGSVAAGATLMYLLDPEHGRRRRALARDKMTALARRTGDAFWVTARDLRNRIRGVIAETRALGRDTEVADQVLEERVRSKLGFLVSHPRAITVEARDGRIMLSGPILAREIEPLIAHVRKIRGVHGVENHLEAHEDADIPALQGESAVGPPRWDLFQRNWSPTTRLLAGIAGSALAVYGVQRRGSIGATAGILGGGALFRALTNIAPPDWGMTAAQRAPASGQSADRGEKAAKAGGENREQLDGKMAVTLGS